MFPTVRRLMLLPLLLLAACAPAAPSASPAPPVSTAPERAENQVIRVGISSIPANLTPQSGFSNLWVWTAMYDTVVEIGKEFEVLPALAEKWSLSQDGTVWTFTIRKGAKFSNGDPVTTEDAAFSYNEMIARNWPSKTFINSVTEAKVVDDTSFTIKTRTPDMSALSGSGFVLIIPKKYYESVGGFDGFTAKPIGSGPYLATDYVRDSRINYKLRPEPHPFRKVTATELQVIAIPDHAQKINGLRTGDLDILAPASFSTDQVAQAEASGLKYQTQRNAFIFLAIPHSTAEAKSTPLLDKRVRLALNYAIDKEAISKTLYRGFAQPLGQLALPGSQSYDPNVKPIFDLPRAKQLLAEAGYPTGLRAPLTVDVSTAQNLGDLLVAIQSMWKEIGVTLEINTIDTALYTDKVYGRNGQVKSDFVASGNGDTNGFQTAIRVVYGCGKPIGSPASALFYCNQAWDAKLDQALAERDATARVRLFREANQILRDDGYFIPMYAPGSFLISSPKILGVEVENRTQFNFDGVYRIK